MGNKLKPCPRCGDISLYVSDGDYYSGYESHGFRVSCRCHYAWNAVPWCKTEEEAVARWNSQVNKKRMYYRKCPVCGGRFEQKEMVRSNEYDGGWVCNDCFDDTQNARHAEYFIDEW